MADREPTRIGRVRKVQGSTVVAELDPDLAGVSPIYEGRIHNVGQVGSPLRVPQGMVDLIGMVRLVGLSESMASGDEIVGEQALDRILELELIGEIDHGSGRFERGIGTYPSLDDPVHFATASDLQAIFPDPGEDRVPFGHLSSDHDVPISLDIERLVLHHLAIVGSTGAGKTSAVATLLQNLARKGWQNSNILVIDPHGEYASALADDASVHTVLGETGGQLKVPYWALPASDILRIFTRGSGRGRDRFEDLVTEKRREFVEEADWPEVDPSAVGADTPIPFDIREVWYRLDYENNETRAETADPDTVEKIDEGSAADLEPAEFQPYSQTGPPNKGPNYGRYDTLPDQLRHGLLDPQLAFFQKPEADPDGDDPLVFVVEEWLGSDQPVSILDFSGVPARATEAAVGVILDLLFEVAIRADEDGPGIGRPEPLLVVLEEAHRYMGEEASGLTREAANRVAREGRKYGVGLAAVTQRPTELPDTALAQCGTLISLRLTNPGDQSAVRAGLPDTVSGLADALPSLRTHEAVISGQAVEFPVRAFVAEPEPWPEADDPSLDSWKEDPQSPTIEPLLNEWRETYQ